jgi:hypothetical protein
MKKKERKTKMKTIDIQINQARLLTYNVILPEKGIPDISAQIGLYTGTKQMASFYIHTSTYGSGVKVELPMEIIEPIVEIARHLETIVIRECNKELKRLPEIIENGQ